MAGRTILDNFIQYAATVAVAILDVNILFRWKPNRAGRATMLTQTVEYALRALVALAAKPTTPQTNRDLAEVTKVPGPYLSKVLQLLTKADLAVAHRGAHGGFSLARSPEDISILQAVNAVDPIQRITTCPLGLKAHGKHLCPLHKKMDTALAQMEEAFGSTTLADVIAEPSRSRPLCAFPRVSCN